MDYFLCLAKQRFLLFCDANASQCGRVAKAHVWYIIFQILHHELWYTLYSLQCEIGNWHIWGNSLTIRVLPWIFCGFEYHILLHYTTFGHFLVCSLLSINHPRHKLWRQRYQRETSSSIWQLEKGDRVKPNRSF